MGLEPSEHTLCCMLQLFCNAEEMNYLFANPTSDNSNLNCGTFFKDKENNNKLSSLAASEAVEKRN
jgi:hypothetical protein